MSDEDFTKEEMLAMLVRVEAYFAHREAKLGRRFSIREELQALIEKAAKEA